MDSRDNPLYWSIPCGTWFMTQVRVSLLLPLICLPICWNLPSVKLGLAFSGVLFVSLLVHEFSHIFAARLTGGVGNEILIWPLGGLAYVQPGASFASQFLTPAAGPLSNLTLCALVSPAVWKGGLFPAVLNPIYFPQVTLNGNAAAELMALVFWCNWILTLLNLVPAFPLDGARMVLAAVKHRMQLESALEIATRTSFAASILVMIAGLMANATFIVAIGSVVLFMTLFEWFQMRTSESLDDSFMGYDFSQGYTSLERSTRQNPSRRKRTSGLQRWRERRRLEKERRERLEDERVQQQLDLLLEKVHQSGFESLSELERRQLKRASDRFRERGKQKNSQQSDEK